MPEELEGKKKPKTALIKHKKEELPQPVAAAEQPPQLKKVVVKRRVVVKKATPARPTAEEATTAAGAHPAEPSTPARGPEIPPSIRKPATAAHTPAAKIPAREAPTAARAPAAGARAGQAAAAAQPRAHAPVGRASEVERTTFRERPPVSRPPEIERTTFRERPPEPPPSVREKARIGYVPPARSSGIGPGGGGYGGRPSGGGYAGRPPFGGRPGGPPRPGQAPAKPGEDKKPAAGGKKFFTKGKKRPDWLKRKHAEPEEKSLSVKKKTIIMANPVPKEISITGAITVSDLAKKMNLKGSDLIHKLMSLGTMVTLNQQIDSDTAQLLAAEYDCRIHVVSLYDETVIEEEVGRDEDIARRSPIVTVMGHVDHGKTKLLDAIRSTNVADGEYGGITQHIGAYSVETSRGRIVFIDTPGHEAFTKMRARGAQVTDIVVLVVSAVDGVMPQTIEAINHAKDAKVPIIVAVNKMDLPDTNLELVKKQLSEHGLSPEEWGGTTLYNPVSALKKTGINELLDSILLQSEMLDLKANPHTRASGIVLESRVDMGRGIVGTVVIQKGTLKVGDSFVAGIWPGKVRALYDDKGTKIAEAPPAMPVEVIGFDSIPNAGDPFQATDTERTAKVIGTKRQELRRMEETREVKKVTLANLYEQIKEGEIQDLKVVIKADVHGSVEALKTALERLSTPEIRLSVIHAGAGAINESDVLLASTSNALIIGFHVRPSSPAQVVADREKVEIRKYNIIYDAVEDIRSAMEGMLKPELKEEQVGTVEVRNVFKISRVGTIAGCHVTQGKIRRSSDVRLIREGVEVFKGRIASLKRFKDDAREVEQGFECGIGLENFNDIEVGDLIEAYETRELARKIEAARDGGASA
ncbi:MAG: translation initiation factor IF-2 [Spirochaetes bacterium]|nr:translation initiation factor IF-2 [Spirochaetota bacterium]